MQRTTFGKLFAPAGDHSRSLFITTHSPNIASVVPLKSVVVLRGTTEGTVGHSVANLALSPIELEDLQRYIDTTRADLLFAKGVVLVEGDAEAALVPIFAKSLGYDLDALGVAVCNVGGVNFRPYVKLAVLLGMPYSVVTDWDPLDGTKEPLGRKRAMDLWLARTEARGLIALDPTAKATVEATTDADFREKAAPRMGVFLNASTLEIEVAQSPTLLAALLAVLEGEGFGRTRRARIAAWKAGLVAPDPQQLMAMIADIGKGRLAARLGAKVSGLTPPEYIKKAIEHVTKRI